VVFLLAPIYLSSRESSLGKLVNLSYPVGDLALLFGLMLIWLRHRVEEPDRAMVALLIAATICLVVADSWVAIILLNASSYQSGSPPDLFWMAFYALVPLAGLVRFRLTRLRLSGVEVGPMDQQPRDLGRQDVIAGLRITAPVAAALLASTVLFVRTELAMGPPRSVVPPLIVLGLLGLALVRQGLTAVENERLRREREEALRETTRQIETFVGVAGHELKNPLASMQVGLEMVERRIRRLLGRERVEVADVAQLLEPVVQAEQQEGRLDRLVNDLVDAARVRSGRLDLHMVPMDLGALVRETVEDQRRLNPGRTIHLEGTRDGEEQLVPVLGDAHRLGQVVTNYLTNALKYSPADRPVAVGLQVDGHQARLWVRDAGPGLPAEEHARIWARFHRAEGIEVQSGTGVGLGLGLHVARTIIEQHHGQVGVQSTPGHGSTFWFTLPLARQEPAQEESGGDTPEGLSEGGERWT
jgi:signal transduction histidine kinase